MKYIGGFMRKLRNYIITILIMAIVSLLCLVILSIFTYNYKWQADKALIGITYTYILTGLVGGLSQKILCKESKSMGRKMLEGMIFSSLFMGGLVVLSIFQAGNPFEISSRFLMIWMLLMGSTCLGRIL